MFYNAHLAESQEMGMCECLDDGVEPAKRDNRRKLTLWAARAAPRETEAKLTDSAAHQMEPHRG